LFYSVRLLIYHTEALEKPEPEKSILSNQYKIMSSRLWKIITWPAAFLSLIFGLALLHPYLNNLPNWLIVKLILVGGLLIYQLLTFAIYKGLRKNIVKYSSTQLRVWNEVVTLFLFAIVFLVILRDTLNMLYATAGLFLLAIILMVAVKFYKRIRNS